MTAKDIMVTDVITVTPQTKLLEIEKIFHEHNIAMVPVIDPDSKIVQGVVTEQELFSSDRKIHLPSYIRLLKETEFVQHDKSKLPYTAEQLVNADAFWVMNKNVFFARPSMGQEELANILAGRGADTLVVADDANRLLGIVSRRDYIAKYTRNDYIWAQKAKPAVRRIDSELDDAYVKLRSRFAFVSKARANIWLTTAVVLFMVGFIIGFFYIFNIGI